MLKNLKQLRSQRGISQQQLATILGLSQQSINKYENHNVEPDIRTLTALSDYFGTTIDYLVGRFESDSVAESIPLRLTPSEIALITSYRELSQTEQTCILTLAETYRNLKRK